MLNYYIKKNIKFNKYSLKSYRQNLYLNSILINKKIFFNNYKFQKSFSKKKNLFFFFIYFFKKYKKKKLKYSKLSYKNINIYPIYQYTFFFRFKYSIFFFKGKITRFLWFFFYKSFLYYQKKKIIIKKNLIILYSIFINYKKNLIKNYKYSNIYICLKSKLFFFFSKFIFNLNLQKKKFYSKIKEISLYKEKVTIYLFKIILDFFSFKSKKVLLKPKYVNEWKEKQIKLFRFNLLSQLMYTYNPKIMNKEEHIEIHKSNIILFLKSINELSVWSFFFGFLGPRITDFAYFYFRNKNNSIFFKNKNRYLRFFDYKKRFYNNYYFRFFNFRKKKKNLWKNKSKDLFNIKNKKKKLIYLFSIFLSKMLCFMRFSFFFIYFFINKRKTFKKNSFFKYKDRFKTYRFKNTYLVGNLFNFLYEIFFFKFLYENIVYFRLKFLIKRIKYILFYLFLIKINNIFFIFKIKLHFIKCFLFFYKKKVILYLLLLYNYFFLSSILSIFYIKLNSNIHETLLFNINIKKKYPPFRRRKFRKLIFSIKHNKLVSKKLFSKVWHNNKVPISWQHRYAFAYKKFIPYSLYLNGKSGYLSIFQYYKKKYSYINFNYIYYFLIKYINFFIYFLLVKKNNKSYKNFLYFSIKNKSLNKFRLNNTFKFNRYIKRKYIFKNNKIKLSNNFIFFIRKRNKNKFNSLLKHYISNCREINFSINHTLLLNSVLIDSLNSRFINLGQFPNFFLSFFYKI